MQKTDAVIQSQLKDQRFVAVLLDETKDVSNLEQLVVHYRISLRGDIKHIFGEMIALGVSQTGESIHIAVNAFLDRMFSFSIVVLHAVYR